MKEIKIIEMTIDASKERFESVCKNLKITYKGKNVSDHITRLDVVATSADMFEGKNVQFLNDLSKLGEWRN